MIDYEPLTPRWTPMRYHPEQSRLLLSEKRFKAVVAGRGSGKTEIARRYVVMKMFEAKPWPDPLYFYVLPTSNQAKRVAWRAFLDLIPPNLIREKNVNDLTITTVIGSTLHLVSGEKPERLEGVQWDGGVIDESSDQKETIFDLNLGPAIKHRNAWCWRIGVPKRRGPGAKDFREFWLKGVHGDAEIDSFHWKSADILSPEELAWEKENLSPQDYREQYEASWEQTSGLIFQDFSHENIYDECIYRPSLPIIVGSDFNVDPMAWTLCHFFPKKRTGLAYDVLYCFDEIFIKGTNTRKSLDELFNRYGTHNAGWIFIGDATSRARKTSANESDYLIIANDKRFKNKEVIYPKSNPAVADRFSATNAAILNAAGQRRLLVHPNCKKLIEDLENRYYKPGTSIPADEGDIGHITDAIGYAVCKLLPMEIENISTPRVIIR